MNKQYEDTATDALQFAKDFLYIGIVFTAEVSVKRDPHFNGVWRLRGITEYDEPKIGIIYLPGDDYPHNNGAPVQFQGDVEIGDVPEHEFSAGYR